MSDIFISYAHEDRDAAQRLAHALEQLQWTVFWDRVIPAGKTWREVIGTALIDAKCVIVLWSRTSIASNWVIEEAEDGLKRGLLVPIFIEPVDPPLGFRSVQAADLSSWDGTLTAREFEDVVRDVRAVAGGLQHTPETTMPRLAPKRDRRLSVPRYAWAAIAVAVIAVVALLYYRSGKETPAVATIPIAPAPATRGKSTSAPKTPAAETTRNWALRAHFINVGQASSTLLEFPRAALLVDAGTDGDESKAHLMDYLRDFFQSRPDLEGRLDALVLTHPHVDHINAALDVLSNHAVDTLVDNGDAGTGSRGSQLRAVRAYAASRKIRPLQLTGDDTAKGYLLDIPRADGTIRLAGGSRDCQNKNNDSLVIEIVAVNSRVLLPADADLDDRECEGLIPYLLIHMPPQRADVFQVPHHGSTSGLSEEFLKRFSPAVAVISAGRVDIQPKTTFDAFNYGHPRATTVETLARSVSGSRDTRRVFVMGATKKPELTEISKAVYCTCWDGDIVMSLDGTGRAPKVERPASRP